MLTNIEQTLYIDIQAQKPVSFCPQCGGELYSQDGICLRCERRRP